MDSLSVLKERNWDSTSAYLPLFGLSLVFAYLDAGEELVAASSSDSGSDGAFSNPGVGIPAVCADISAMVVYVCYDDGTGDHEGGGEPGKIPYDTEDACFIL